VIDLLISLLLIPYCSGGWHDLQPPDCIYHVAAGLIIKHPGAQAIPHLGCSLKEISVIRMKSSLRSA
jgi:hypothetical protein